MHGYIDDKEILGGADAFFAQMEKVKAEPRVVSFVHASNNGS